MVESDQAEARKLSSRSHEPQARQIIAPIYAVALAIIAGDALGNCHFVISSWLAVLIGIIALAAMLRGRTTLGLAAAYLAIAIAAAACTAQILDPPRRPDSIATLIDGSPITIEGRLVRETEREAYGERLYVAVASAAQKGEGARPMRGTVRIAVLGGGDFRLGDEIRLTGRIHFPHNYGNPREFDYAAQMARDGIDATMTAPKNSSAPKKSFGTPAFQIIGHHSSFPWSEIESIRTNIGAFFDRNLTYPENAEMRALVIGDRGEIREPLRQTFARTGMAHLLVISGLHLSIVAAAVFGFVRLVMMLFRGLANRGYANKIAALAAMLAVCAYASIAGHHVSTVRALVMVLAYMLAITIDRSSEAIASLALAAIVICVALPGSTADIGFQLSFASVIAIVLGMRRFTAWFARRKRLGRLAGEAPSRNWRLAEIAVGYLAVSFWATIGTAALTAYHFNQFAIVGLVANAVVVPIMALGATISGLVAAALSFISEPLARLVLLFGAKALALGNWLAEWFVRWPLAWERIFTPTTLELAIVYALLMIWLLAPLARVPDPKVSQPTERNRDARFGWRTWSAAALAIALTIDAAAWTYDRFLNPDLRVTFLSVGEGDGAVVRFPGSRVMLIDAGGAYGGFDTGERIVAPYLWSQKIMHVDYIVLSHPDFDHFGGLDFIAINFAPDAFWTNGAESLDLSFARFMDDIARAKIPVVKVGRIAPLPEIGGVSITSLNGDVGAEATHNNSSMVLKFTLGRASILFTGDIESAGERAMLESRRDLRSTILKVPHHGSATSSTAAFIAAVHPDAAVISDGYLNHFHFPSAVVLNRYLDAGVRVLRTDTDGAVLIDATVDRMTIQTRHAHWLLEPKP